MHRIDYDFHDPSIMDLKVGRQLYDPVKDNQTRWKRLKMRLLAALNLSLMRYGFSIQGIRWKRYSLGKTWHEMQSESHISMKQSVLSFGNVESNFEKFFEIKKWQNQHIIPVLDYAQERILKIIQFLMQHPQIRLVGSSVVMFFESISLIDRDPGFKLKVRLLDFAHAHYLTESEEVPLVPDMKVIKGLRSIRRFLNKMIRSLN